MLKTCPSPDQLRRLLADQLGESQEDSIGEHVEECPHCQESLERLTDADIRPGGMSPLAGVLWDQTEVDDDFLNALKCDPPVAVRSWGRSVAIGFAVFRCGYPLWICPTGWPRKATKFSTSGAAEAWESSTRPASARLDRPIALKMLLAGNYAAPRELDRFRREAEAIARLQHPHIVQIHEIGEHEGRPYLALEYVDGDSLARHIDATPQPAIRSAEIVAILARAIHEAHCLGIIHRDLKPANVLLTAAGEPKITDFGLAKRLDDDDAFPTLTEQFMGTPSYMAPEQAVRERTRSPRGSARTKATAAVDIYSLGAILYEMLTGRPPFRAETPLETVLQVLHEEPVPPSRLRPNVPRDLETICLKCLEKSPQRRYVTALDLALDLDEVPSNGTCQGSTRIDRRAAVAVVSPQEGAGHCGGPGRLGDHDDDRPVDQPGRPSLSGGPPAG